VSPNVRGRGWQDQNGAQADRTRRGRAQGESTTIAISRLASQDRSNGKTSARAGGALDVFSDSTSWASASGGSFEVDAGPFGLYLATGRVEVRGTAGDGLYVNIGGDRVIAEDSRVMPPVGLESYSYSTAYVSLSALVVLGSPGYSGIGHLNWQIYSGDDAITDGGLTLYLLREL